MSIGLTTVILFAVFGILLFLSCPISVSIVIASIVTAVSSLSWDQITFITMQKRTAAWRASPCLPSLSLSWPATS